MYRLAHRSSVKSRDFMATCLIATVMEERELCEFLLLAEDAILAIQRNCEFGSPDLEDVLLQTDLLVKDVVLIEGLVEHDDDETLLGDDIVQAVSGVARAVRELSDEHQKHHMSGRPEIPISEEHLALLLEYRFTTRAIANMFRVSPPDNQEDCEVWIR